MKLFTSIGHKLHNMVGYNYVWTVLVLKSTNEPIYMLWCARVAHTIHWKKSSRSAIFPPKYYISTWTNSILCSSHKESQTCLRTSSNLDKLHIIRWCLVIDMGGAVHVVTPRTWICFIQAAGRGSCHFVLGRVLGLSKGMTDSILSIPSFIFSIEDPNEMRIQLPLPKQSPGTIATWNITFAMCR